jgi:hypothetical protein
VSRKPVSVPINVGIQGDWSAGSFANEEELIEEA